ncbi:3-hydroxyacyl-CoA dehydrogenase family protein, partial [Verrucomicrobiota bacterium]
PTNTSSPAAARSGHSPTLSVQIVVKAQDISRVAIIGAGTMGAGLAGEFARAGCDVRLVDLSDDMLQRGLKMQADAQKALIEAKLLSAREAAAALKRIRPLTCLKTACDQVELLIEAVSEDMAVKHEMFRQFDELCPGGSILASNTSGLSITEIARATKRPELVAGMHFWNPPHIIPLVEVTKGEETSDSTAELLVEMCRRIGKRPILVRHSIPGFVGNRLQFAVLREALHILSDGIASAKDIDAAMTAGPGLRYGLLGPLRTADLGGLDVFLAISKYLFADLNSEGSAPALMEELVRKGRLGAKTGSGFYKYTKEELSEILAQRDRVILGFLKVLKEQRGAQDD